MMGKGWDSTGAQYRDLLLRLMPRGKIWGAIQSGGGTYAMLYAIGDVWSDVHERIMQILDTEAHPGTADETLGAWERAYGLPEFGVAPATDDDRRLILSGKVRAIGGQFANYFEAVAIKYGATVSHVYDGPWTHWWTASIGSDCVRATCKDSVGLSPNQTPLVTFTSPIGTAIRSAFEKYRPAHTRIFWNNQ